MRFFCRYSLVLCFLLASACSDDPKDDNNSKTDTEIAADAGFDTTDQDTDETPDTQPGIDTPAPEDTAPDVPDVPDTCPAGTIDVNGDTSRCLDQIQITTGLRSTCAITLEGTLYCWGYNYEDYSLPKTTAQQVGSDDGWQNVATGEFHTCAIQSGELFCWGRNTKGQLGNAVQNDDVITEPTQIGTNDNWSLVAAGNFFTCAIQTGELFCWGENQYGQVGNNDTDDVLEPTQIGTDDGWTHISAGNNHICGIQSGELYCWGNTTSREEADDNADDQRAPTRIGTENDWTDISAGSEHTCAIRQSNLYCWGNNDGSQLGIEDTTTEPSPTLVDDTHDWKSVAAGQAHSCATTENNELFCWGKNDYNQLGNADNDDVPTPTQIDDRDDWHAVTAAAHHTCGILDNNFFCWGNSANGVLGTARLGGSYQTAPTPVGTQDSWDTISNGQNHSCAIRDGELYCWGSNQKGRLGNGQNSFHTTRTPEQIGTDSDWTTVSTGLEHTCGIRNDSDLYCWGSESGGALGIADATAPLLIPTRVGDDSDWTHVTADRLKTCAIRNDGDLYCWGYNNAGQLGIGNSDTMNTPTQVGTSTSYETDWQAISPGEWHTCGIRDGELYCWGSTAYLGSLGDGTTNSSNVPVRVGTSPDLHDDWTHVTVSYNRTCAIRDGQTYCWGYKPVGDGTDTSRLLPTKISDDETATDITSAQDHACAIWNGNLMCWGSNNAYQLGTTAPSTDKPIQIGTHDDWTTLSNTCGIRDGGKLFCWGNNSSGQLGLPDTDSPQPVVGL